MRDPDEILHAVFGFEAFRGTQRQVIDRVMAGKDALAIMPTGAGKSLCYQIPALARPGTALVVSPLIALMHDQVRAADAVGIKAATLTSADANRAETADRFRAGDLDLLYVAPERASMPQFQDMLGQVPLSLVAIDEAHCISEWGHDFRPDYRLLRPLLDRLEGVPRLGLTATADEATRKDVLAQLGMEDEALIVAGFDRPNIRYVIRPRTGLKQQVKALIDEQPGPGIVYAPSRAKAERLAAEIAATGRNAAVYHAGLPPQERAKNQADFVASEDMVICATIAFGMGIDKPDVRFVAHAGIPKSIEAYYQETGRAGRDGDPAEAHLFWGAEDFSRARQRIESEIEPDRRAGERSRLNALGALVETAGCRRAILLRHFGEDPPERCGNCDNCLEPPTAIDATETARKLLSAVYRTGQRFGVGHVVAVLAGKPSDRIVDLGHDRLSVWDILSDDEEPMVRPVARALQTREALVLTDHGGLALGPNARSILRGEEAVELVLPPKRQRRRRKNQEANPVGDPLFDALRERRREIAAENAVPPYVIFHDSTLREMAAAKPASIAEMSKIAGVGEAKLARYGEDFLRVIEELAGTGS
ncbi:DNA helicase RecQ [uncultured Parasphingopyxis sp.]|uniref:DNA helicase RecQ n=1 Tax=uncultured Parasphingopyxis sp. TaxID=1547918 RepID=UPI00262267A4|nr:DNA helicase RecQ [uncultured Parasphingopyxis sp.]